MAVLRQLSEGRDEPSVYQRNLEPQVMRESKRFYQAEAEKLLQTCDATEYLQRVRFIFVSVTFCSFVTL